MCRIEKNVTIINEKTNANEKTKRKSHLNEEYNNRTTEKTNDELMFPHVRSHIYG